MAIFQQKKNEIKNSHCSHKIVNEERNLSTILFCLNWKVVSHCPFPAFLWLFYWLPSYHLLYLTFMISYSNVNISCVKTKFETIANFPLVNASLIARILIHENFWLFNNFLMKKILNVLSTMKISCRNLLL